MYADVGKPISYKGTCLAQITGPITKTISKQGIYKVYEMMNAADKEKFEKAYSASYLPAKEILQEIYDEVKSGTCLPRKNLLEISGISSACMRVCVCVCSCLACASCVS